VLPTTAGATAAPSARSRTAASPSEGGNGGGGAGVLTESSNYKQVWYLKFSMGGGVWPASRSTSMRLVAVLGTLRET